MLAVPEMDPWDTESEEQSEKGGGDGSFDDEHGGDMIEDEDEEEERAELALLAAAGAAAAPAAAAMVATAAAAVEDVEDVEVEEVEDMEDVGGISEYASESDISVMSAWLQGMDAIEGEPASLPSTEPTQLLKQASLAFFFGMPTKISYEKVKLSDGQILFKS